MDRELTLVNFRVPVGLKREFERTCRSRRSTMSSELNRMVRDYVHQEGQMVRCEEESEFEPICFISSNED